MSNLLIVNVLAWSNEQVANWLEGLDDTIQEYVDNFVTGEITGKKLLVLDHQDLDKLGVCKLGHQELFLEAIDLLCQLQYALENETIQSMALKLGCQAKCVYNDTEQYEKVFQKQNTDRLPVVVLSGIAKVVAHTKLLVSWLDRAPFDSSGEYVKKRNQLVKLATDLIATVQGDSVFDSTDDVKDHCQTIADLCDNLIQNSKDTLTIQPAWLEMAIIRKKPEEELGMHIQSSYSGTHTIGGIKEKSPAYLCGKIEEGDEVVMVNGQVVIGWQLKKLVNTLKENKKEINLTLKKRPCHADPFGHKAHRRKRANKLQPAAGTFPRRPMSRKSKKNRIQLTLISTTPEQSTETFNESVKEVESENDALDDNDNVFRSGSESPGFQNLRTFDDKVKLRRATVSGGSPTLKRPSIMISDSDSAPRPKSYALALSSPGSEGFSSLELSSFDLGSPASERTSPPTDSDTGSKILSPPPTINIYGSNKVKTNSVSSGNNIKSLTSSPPCIIKTEDNSSSDIKDVKVNGSSRCSNTNIVEKDSQLSRSQCCTNDADDVTTDKCNQETTLLQCNENHRNIPSQQTLSPGNQNSVTPIVQSPVTPVNQEPVTPTNQTPTKPESEISDINVNQKTEMVTPIVNKNIGYGFSSNMGAGRETRTPSPAKSLSSNDSGTSYSSSSGAYPKSRKYTPGSESPKTVKSTAGSHSPYHKKSNEQAAKVIAGAVEELKSPTLISIKRIDSIYRAELAEQERRQRGELSSPESLSGRVTPQEDDRPQSVVASYTVNIVGGVPQIMKSPNPNMPKDKGSTPQSPSLSILRDKGDRNKKKSFGSRLKANRRVSCKDLGQGDCQGWLLKKKEGHGIGSKFAKRWFVLKNNNLYYYKDPDDMKAQGVIHLPGFQVSPAPEVKTKKCAFKAHHSGTTFYFASERQEDAAKWMNKMGLAAIVYNTEGLITTAGFVKPDDKNLSAVIENPQAGYYSESDEDEEHGETDSLFSSKDDLVAFSKSITRDNVKLDGQNVNDTRIKRLTKNVDLLDICNPHEMEKLKRLNSLERTLKVKENELIAIQQLLENSDIDSDALESFKSEHPDVLNSLQEEASGGHSTQSPTSEED